MKANKNPQSIRLDPEIKGWLYTRCQNENRSLSNMVNTILKKERDSVVMCDVEGQILKGILSRADK